jgi:hypothetical protein
MSSDERLTPSPHKWSNPVRKLLSVVYAVPFLICGTAQAQVASFIFGEDGQRCEYTKLVVPADHYFSATLSANTEHIRFIGPCMKDTALNRTMINSVITRSYGRPDARYATKAEELVPKAGPQERGLCIRSTNYPTLAMAVDYKVHEGSITTVTYANWPPCAQP